jgi:allantoinase
MIASDHSTCEPTMRQQSIRNAWGGLSGLQYQLPATWTAANQMSEWNAAEIDMAKWWSRNPAGMAGLSDRGSIEPGKRSDLVVWDTAYVDAPDNHSREYHRWKGDCYYSSQKLRGRVLETWLGGTQIYDGIKDELLCEMGSYIEHSE